MEQIFIASLKKPTIAPSFSANTFNLICYFDILLFFWKCIWQFIFQEFTIINSVCEPLSLRKSHSRFTFKTWIYLVASLIYLLFKNSLHFYKFQKARFKQEERVREREFCNRILPEPTLSSLLAKGLCVNYFQDLSLKGSQRLHKRTGPKWLITFNLWPFTQLPHTCELEILWENA